MRNLERGDCSNLHFEKIAVSTVREMVGRARTKKRDMLGSYELGNPDEGWSLDMVQAGTGNCGSFES